MNRINRPIKSVNRDSDVASPLRIATLLWSIAIYFGALMLQNSYDKSMIGILTFTLILAIPLNSFLFWFSFLFTEKWVWLYFILHGGLIFTSAILIPNGSPVLLIGLIPILVAQSMMVFHKKRKTSARVRGFLQQPRYQEHLLSRLTRHRSQRYCRS